jgi:diguanylate cyclase (GGDEF)-like protein
MSPDRTAPPPPNEATLVERLRAEIKRLKDDLIRMEWKIAELETRADVDPLLDILNRRGFERELKRSLAFVARYGASAALLYFDLDGFKTINDGHGHGGGDALLQAVARELTRNVRASDVVGRLGGDEFGVLLWHVSADLAAVKARDLESVVAATAVQHGAARLSVGASAGVAVMRGDCGPEQMLDTADKAMYARKKEKRVK